MKRESGYYWVRVRNRKRSHILLIARYIGEPWTAAEPWQVGGEWFQDDELQVISDRLVPPKEAA